MNVTQTRTTPIAPPTIETRPALFFAGLSRQHRMSAPMGIPAQWQDFRPSIGNIDGQIGGAAYGIVATHEGSDDLFTYTVAVEVKQSATVPAELVRIATPSMRWARFTHEGDITAIRSTIGAANEWLSQNGYESNEAEHSFLEYYGPGFDPATGGGDVELWFGLKD